MSEGGREGEREGEREREKERGGTQRHQHCLEIQPPQHSPISGLRVMTRESEIGQRLRVKGLMEVVGRVMTAAPSNLRLESHDSRVQSQS